MKLDSLMISILLACIMLIGGLMIIGEQQTTYDINITDEMFENISGIANEIYVESEEMREDLIPGEVEEATAWEILVIGAYSAVTKVWQFFALAGQLIVTAGTAIGIPAFIMNLFIIIIMISALFSLIYMIFRFQPR